MTRKRVTLDGETLDHVISYGLFFDGSGAALCGKSPWPDRWLEQPHPQSVGDKRLCVDCAQTLRTRR